MSHSHQTIADRVVAAIRMKPMTIRQIGEAVSASDNYLRVAMDRLERAGKVRRKGFAQKSRTGATPYLWEAA